LRNELTTVLEEVEKLYGNLEFPQAIDAIMNVVHLGNKYFNDQQPWKVRVSNPERAQTIAYVTMEVVNVLQHVTDWIACSSLCLVTSTNHASFYDHTIR